VLLPVRRHNVQPVAPRQILRQSDWPLDLNHVSQRMVRAESPRRRQPLPKQQRQALRTAADGASSKCLTGRNGPMECRLNTRTGQVRQIATARRPGRVQNHLMNACFALPVGRRRRLGIRPTEQSAFRGRIGLTLPAVLILAHV
jgi:hypothetical protein